MSEPEKDLEAKVRVRWGLIAGITILGLGVTAIPFALVWLQGTAFGDWQSLLSSTLTNIGTAILLVAVFWFLERRFTEHLRDEVRETTRTAVTEETRELAATQRALSQRLDEIQDRLNERVAQERSQQDEVLHRLNDGISFEAVSSALTLARELRAVWHEELTIPVGDGGPDRPRFQFRLSVSTSVPPHRVRDNDDLTPLIEVEYEQVASGNHPVIVHWSSGTQADEVLGELRRSITALGHAEQAARVDASLFANLQHALEEAVAGRRRDPGSWLKGALAEWINADWAVTSHGLEHRGPHGMRSTEFPVRWNGRSNAESRMWKPPVAPEGVDKEWWDFLMTRARRRHRSGVRLPA